MAVTQPIPPEALAAWQRGDKLRALRELRQATGLGLKEARDVLASGSSVVQLPGSPSALAAVPREAAAAARRGDKLEAIRIVRQATGLDLKAAKAMVEGWAGEAVDPDAIRRPALSPGEVPRSRVEWGRVLVTFAVIAALAVVAARFLRA